MTFHALRAGRAMLATGCLLLLYDPTNADAHGIAGARLFPATLAIDDPAVQDELSIPTFARSIESDGTIEHDVGFELDKRITETFEIAVGDTYSHFSDSRSGFQNLGLLGKYLVTVNPEHEFMLSVGLDSEVGGTGAASIADRFSTIGPQVYAGKGFGDLPTSLDALRPFAVTTQVGFGIPTRGATVTPADDGGPPSIDRNPTILNWGFSLQYSLLYLDQNIREIQGPDILKRLIPTVELALETPIANVPTGPFGSATTGTVNPGVFYEADKYQLGVEAMLPINAASGRHPGFIAQLHFFLDDIFPNSIGRPIIQ